MPSPIDELARMTLDAMLADLATTLAIHAHQEIQRSRSLCARCNTRCRDRSQLPSSFPSTTLSIDPPTHTKSRSATPQLAAAVENSGIGFNAQGNLVPGAGSANNGGMTVKNGVIYFDCLVCSRPIASNRYAPHLASCLGLTGASRRATSRAAAVNGIQRSKLASERSTPSPYVDFDSEGSDVGSTGTGGGGRKATKNGNGKRQTNSPAKNGEYSTGAPSGKKSKIVHTYSSGSNSKHRGPSPAYSTASSHPLAQSALPPPPQTTSSLASPLKPRSRGEDDESFASEDAEGESDDEDEADASGEAFEDEYAMQNRQVADTAAAGSAEGEWRSYIPVLDKYLG